MGIKVKVREDRSLFWHHPWKLMLAYADQLLRLHVGAGKLTCGSVLQRSFILCASVREGWPCPWWESSVAFIRPALGLERRKAFWTELFRLQTHWCFCFNLPSMWMFCMVTNIFPRRWRRGVYVLHMMMSQWVYGIRESSPEESWRIMDSNCYQNLSQSQSLHHWF